MTGRPGGARGLAPLLLAAVVGATSTSCAEVVEEAGDVHHPAVVTEGTGGDAALIAFDEVAADRVHLRTATVRRTPAGPVVPYESLIYTPDGKTWVYVADGPLRFRREEVRVDRIMGDRVWLRKAPTVGTEVVTTGAAEVYGAELGIEGGH
jgi:hypothetical protein